MSTGRHRPLLKGFLTLLFLAAIAAAVVRAFVLLPAQAQGNEMAPAVFRGDWVAAAMRAKPIRGDVILYEHPQKKGVLRMGRLIGLPGEAVSFKDQVVSVAGKALARTKIDKFVLEEDGVPGGRPMERYRETGPDGRSWGVLMDLRRRTRDIEIQAKDGFVVLGDNRNHAVDSREHGPVPVANLRGVVTYYLSAKPVKGIETRGTRVQ
ncbi:MAG: signal peptidase I [Deltaproteobacteria bacterium]|nr:signal peptidase I [Deltaproteobacteria bacterium]